MTSANSELDAAGRKRRHDLLNQAMMTAGVLQDLVAQVRAATQELAATLKADADGSGTGP